MEIREGGAAGLLAAMTDLQERWLKVQASMSMEGSSSDIRATMGELGTI